MHVARNDAVPATPRLKAADPAADQAAVPTRTPPPSAETPHHWRMLRAGRICDECLTVQVKGEYDETLECQGR